MTTMVQPRPVTPESEQGHPILEALKARRTLLVRGGIALLVVVAGIWLYRESGRRKAQAGSEALDQARIAADDLRSFVGRNPPATHAASAYALLGAASENLGRFDDAAQAYARSA